MITARARHTASLLEDGRVLIAGGESLNGPANTLEIFSPATNTLVAMSSGTLSSGRTQHIAAVLADGRVLIAGGSDGTNVLNTAEIFDPASGGDTAAGNMSTARANFSGTTLLDGKVLIASGTDGTVDLVSAEIYDPAVGTFAPTGNLATGRSGHGAFLLPNNNEVLIAGGTSAQAAISSAELLVPWTGVFTATGALSNARFGAAGSALEQEGQLDITATLNDPGSKLSNYSVTLNKGTLTITARALTVTADAQSKVYGTTDPTLTYKVTGGSLVNGDVFTGALTRDAGENAGTYNINQGTLALNSNYNLTYAGAKLTITPDGGKSKILDSTFTAFTGNIVGLKYTDHVNVTYTSPGAPASAPVGSYDITVANITFTSGSASNYTLITNTAIKGLTVSYNACLVYDQTKSVKSGATYPIKLYLCDVNGVDVSSPASVVSATGLTVISGLSGTVEDAGNSNPDSNFRYNSTLGPTSGYIFNLKTTGLSGTYQLTFSVNGISNPLYVAAFGAR
jgi:hypothetical protein